MSCRVDDGVDAATAAAADADGAGNGQVLGGAGWEDGVYDVGHRSQQQVDFNEGVGSVGTRRDGEGSRVCCVNGKGVGDGGVW